MLEAGQRKVRIPVSSRLHPVDREQDQEISRYIVTQHDGRKLAFADDKWRCKCIDSFNRIFVLSYKGCEMRLLFKRQVLDEVIDAGFPLPAQALSSENQEWLSINLVDDAE